MGLVLKISGKFIKIVEKKGGRGLITCSREEATDFKSESEAYQTGREVIQEMKDAVADKAKAANAKGGVLMEQSEAREKHLEHVWLETFEKGGLDSRGSVWNGRLAIPVPPSYFLPKWLQWPSENLHQCMTTDVQGGSEFIQTGRTRYFIAKARGKWITDGFNNLTDSMLKAKIFGDEDAAYRFAEKQNLPQPDLLEMEMRVIDVKPSRWETMDPEVGALKSAIEAQELAKEGKVVENKRVPRKI